MEHRDAVIETIQRAFEATPYPGDAYLQGSFEGCEPYEEVEPFKGRSDWRAIPAEFLDARGGALSFLTEAALRFFLPAYLIADLRGKLRYADPLFHVTHGFFDFTVKIPQGDRVFEIHSGKSALINPRRYGASTAEDYARFRLSVFTREEAGAIAAYLQYKRVSEPEEFQNEQIDAALESFWLERAASAPTAEDLRRQLAEETAYLQALREERLG
ncbi:MAG: hypothetical protein ACYC7E_21410 [Armatimonadota bacterium]